MHFSLLNLFYFAFRMGPFVLVSFFVLSSFFQQDLKCIIYIAGLLFACFLGILTGNSLSLFDLPKGSLANAHCHVLSLGEATPMSKLPLSLIVYCYTAAYLAYPVMQFNKGNADMSLIALFPLLIMIEAMWLLTYQCFTGSSVVVAGAFATAIGFLWSWVIYNSNLKGLHTFTVMGGGQGCVRPAQSTFRCQNKSIDKLKGAERSAYDESGLNTAGESYLLDDGTTLLGSRRGITIGTEGPFPGGGNGNFFWYCPAIEGCKDPNPITDMSNCKDQDKCFVLFDGQSVTNIDSDSSTPIYYRVSIPLQPGVPPGQVKTPAPTLRKYLNDTIAESWDNDYQGSAQKVNVFKNKKGNVDPDIYLVIDTAHPMYHKIPEVGTLVQFTGTAELSNLMAASNESANQAGGSTSNAKSAAFQKTFIVQNYSGVRKLAMFTSQKDVDDYKNAPTKPLILNLDEPTLFQTKGCRLKDATQCDFSGTAMAYEDLVGHCLRPITDPRINDISNGFYYDMTGRNYKPDPEDPFIVNGKTNIYPEGTYVKCKVGGLKPQRSAQQQGNPPKKASVTVPSMLYRVDKYGALNPLPDNPSDIAINYSWDGDKGSWNSPIIYSNCSGIQMNPQLSFNPKLLPPLCQTPSCKLNQAARDLLDSVPTFVDNFTTNGYFDNKDHGSDLSKNLLLFQNDIQSMMIKKLSTSSEKFDEEDIKKISKTIKNISIDLLEIDKIAGNTYVDLIAQRVEEFYKNQGINPPNWAIGKIPKGNQLQFKNQTSLCLEADDPNSKYYDSRILIRNCDSSNPYQKWTYSIANNFLKNDGSGYCVSSRVSQSTKKYGNKYNPVYVDKCTNNFQDQNIILDENGVLITAVGKGEDTWQYFIKSNELNNNKQKIIQLDNDSKWDYKAKYNVV
jgi:uncharacterized protein (DUF2164 family)